MHKYFANEALLESPTKRAAYSDRTSYLMAEMSRLAYFRFEGGSNVEDIIGQVRELLPDNKKLPALEALIKSQVLNSDESESKNILADILQQSGFELVETFCHTGTDAQAFLCVRPSQGMAILAFRGTEPKLKDIKADIKARLVEVDATGKPVNSADPNNKPIKMHSGYLSQFNALREDILEALSRDELKDTQLFITGHSLGGALAITAVKFLASDITGACYTFGSPPVGTKVFDHDIKTPIYRVVNHIDIVPRLPNPIMIYAIRLLGLVIGMGLNLLGGVFSSIKQTAWYDGLSKMLLDAQQYRQSGYGSYLEGEGNNVRLRYSVGTHDQLFWWIKQFMNLFHGDFKLLTDHSIDTYSKKLAIWAERRS